MKLNMMKLRFERIEIKSRSNFDKWAEEKPGRGGG